MTITSPGAATTTTTTTTTGTGPAVTATTGTCTGCGSALAPTAEWCWLCHRAVREPVHLPAASTVDGEPAADGASDTVGTPGPARSRWWRADLRPRTALTLAAALVVVLVPLLSLLLTLGSAADDTSSEGTTGLLGSGERVDVQELDRPAGP